MAGRGDVVDLIDGIDSGGGLEFGTGEHGGGAGAGVGVGEGLGEVDESGAGGGVDLGELVREGFKLGKQGEGDLLAPAGA